MLRDWVYRIITQTDLIACQERGIGARSWPVEDLVDMVVSAFPIARRRVSVDGNCGSHFSKR